MSSFRDYSIRKKLMAMSLWATSAALVLAFLALMACDFLTYKSALVKRLSSLSEIISLNASSAVVFSDPVAATKNLTSLEVRPSMLAAGIYTPDGQLFAHWERDSKESFPTHPLVGQNAHVFSRHFLAIFHPMILDNAVIGTVYMKSDLSELISRLQRYAGVGVVVFFISVFLAALIAFKVGQKISEPLLALAGVAAEVSEKNDYSVRALGGGTDEIGCLIRTFNGMLAKIQQDGAEVQRLNSELEQKVADRTAQLSAANKELEAFSYSVSHDLRTPLRAIDGFSRELLRNSLERLDEQGQSDLHRIRAAAQRMAQLIDDLLKLSRITREEMRPDKVNLSLIANKILDDLRTMQPQRQVDCVIPPDILAMGDFQLLRVALENLLGNAWKFTEKRPDARIEFGEMQKEGKKVYFIRDNGAGFNMAYAEKLFGVFQRLHDARDFAGTGVGLATVQRIIRRHGGDIWAEAEVDHGATFFFTLS